MISKQILRSSALLENIIRPNLLYINDLQVSILFSFCNLEFTSQMEIL